MPDPTKYGWKAKVVRRFILANPYATINECVKATRTAQRTVSRVRKDLIAEGLVMPYHLGRPPGIPLPPDPPPEGLLPANVEEQIRKDLDAAVAKGRILTREERRIRLSAFAEHPLVPTQAKIAALKELEATEPPQETLLGPGAPLTREERIERATLLCEALVDIDGQDALREVVQRVDKAVGLTYDPHAGNGRHSAELDRLLQEIYDAGPDRPETPVDDQVPPAPEAPV